MHFLEIWKFKSETPKKDSRKILQDVLAKYLGIPADQVRLIENENGKPLLETPRRPDLSFNLSHSEKLLVIAVSNLPEIGVDIERVRPIRQSGRISDRYFTPDENAALREVDEPHRTREFIRLWTRKEAMIKSAGLNIVSLPTLKEDDFPFLTHFEPDAGYIGCIASRTPAPECTILHRDC